MERQLPYPIFSPTRAIRLPRVCDLTGASRPTIWRWVREDSDFPKPFSLSAGIAVVVDWQTYADRVSAAIANAPRVIGGDDATD